MALIAWNTDAPVYHWPYATVGLIGLNAAVYLGTWFCDQQTLDAWSLTMGAGLHPVQWFTSSFVHNDIFHLLGNMFFLWAFGLVVEGKVGWMRFVPMYLGLAVVASFIEQLTGLMREPGGPPLLGASDAIFGLLAIAVVWAPENEIEFLFFFMVGGFIFRAHRFSVQIWKVCAWYVAWNLLIALVVGFVKSGILAHLVGAALGFPLAWWMLRAGRVDCEGWDLFTRLDKRRDDRRSVERAEQRRLLTESSLPVPGGLTGGVPEIVKNPESPEKSLIRLQKLLEERKGSAALALYEKVAHLDKRWKLPEAELAKMIDLLHEEKRFVESIPFLEDYLARFFTDEVHLRLRLARILVEIQQRPNYALRVLAPIPETPLPEALERLRTRIKKLAQEQIDDGVLELEGQSW